MAYDVLIVDDSTAIRKILQRMLRQANLPVGKIFEAGDGVEALKALRTQTVNLVLSDFEMPNMDGLQLLSALKASEEWKRIPVIMISAEGGETKVKEAERLGANGYLRKPFTAEHLSAKLHMMR